MGSTVFPSCRISSFFRYDHEASSSSSSSKHIRTAVQSCSSSLVKENENENEKLCPQDSKECNFGRRSAVLATAAAAVAAGLSFPKNGWAVVKQGLLAGRIPGLSEPDQQGWRTYRRPDEKSGGHGVGWSPIIPYTFSVPQDWEEVPVSIADLGGTEIDLRFASPKQGRMFVIVAPVLRFADNLGDDVKIENIGPPDKVISAFGPEAIGENVEGKVLNMEVSEHSGRTYYQYELEPPHALIAVTAAGNRLYMFTITANGLQWKRNYQDLKRIASSFRVV